MLVNATVDWEIVFYGAGSLWLMKMLQLVHGNWVPWT
jgi:hypothetical protein